MNIEIKCFGKLQDSIGNQSVAGSFSTVKNVIDALKVSDDSVKKQVYCIAVNSKIVKSDASVNDGDVISLMPPFAGG